MHAKVHVPSERQASGNADNTTTASAILEIPDHPQRCRLHLYFTLEAPDYRGEMVGSPAS